MAYNEGGNHLMAAMHRWEVEVWEMQNRELKRGEAVIWRTSDWWHAGYVERLGPKGNVVVRTTIGKVEQVAPESLHHPNSRQRELFFPEERPYHAKRR